MKEKINKSLLYFTRGATSVDTIIMKLYFFWDPREV